jgi:hypothetical protein
MQVALVMFVCILTTVRPVHAVDLPITAPERVGFSTERLKRLDQLMQQAVAEQQYGGVVYILARHGKVVRFESIGKPGGTASGKDAIFRLAPP